MSGIDRYDFRVTEGVLGYPEYINAGKRLTLEITKEEAGGLTLEEGKSYLIKGYPPFSSNYGHYGDRMTILLLPLAEGAWFLEGEPDLEKAMQYVTKEDHVSEMNRHALLAITTADMSSMPLVQEISRDFYLEEGRWLDEQDQAEGRRVCVITKEFAQMRDLSVGDSLTMTFLDKELYYLGYTSVDDADTLEACDKTEETLEIVGIYGRLYGETSGDIFTLTDDSVIIYIPDSCLPESYKVDSEIIQQNDFSFILNSPLVKDAFIQEMKGKLEPLGISLSFVENNWDSFYNSARSIREGGFYSFLIFLAVLVLVLGAAAFLYTWQRKREIAIVRALGSPARKAAMCACLPMAVSGAAGILAGGIAAWKYGLARTEKTLAAMVLNSGRNPAGSGPDRVMAGLRRA